MSFKLSDWGYSGYYVYLVSADLKQILDTKIQSEQKYPYYIYLLWSSPKATLAKWKISLSTRSKFGFGNFFKIVNILDTRSCKLRTINYKKYILKNESGIT